MAALWALSWFLVGCAGKQSPTPEMDAEGLKSPQDAGKMTQGEVSEDPLRLFKGDYAVADRYREAPPRSVAVLPFDQGEVILAPGERDPRDLVRRGIHNHMASLPFRMPKPAEVDARLSRAGLSDPKAVASVLATNPKTLKTILGVDAVVMGKATHFDRLYAGLYPQTAVGCEVEMFDLKDGKRLWWAKSVNRSHAGGVSINPIELGVSALYAVWNMREVETLNQGDNLYREIVSTLERHTPKHLWTDPGPKPEIDGFAVLAPGTLLKAGDAVQFRVIAEPGARVGVELGSTEIPLTPVPTALRDAYWSQALAGAREKAHKQGLGQSPELEAALETLPKTREIYEAKREVKAGDYIPNVKPVAHVSANGKDAQTPWEGAPLTLDGRIPKSPKNLVAEPGPKGPSLSWTPSTDPEVVRYVVFAKRPGEPDFSRLAEVAQADTSPGPLPAGTMIAVAAVNRAGNQSDPSAEIVLGQSDPAPAASAKDPSPPKLAAASPETLVLTQKDSPHRFPDGLVVGPGGSLLVEAGAELRFGPNAELKVQGGSIQVLGRPGNPVRIGPIAKVFKGIVLDAAHTARFEHVRIERAQIGLWIKDCSPRFGAVAVLESRQTGVKLDDNAAPEFRCAAFHNNNGMGAVELAGAGAAPRFRDSTFTGNAPFDFQSHAPATIDLSGNYFGPGGPKPERFLGQIRFEPTLDAPPRCP